MPVVLTNPLPLYCHIAWLQRLKQVRRADRAIAEAIRRHYHERLEDGKAK